MRTLNVAVIGAGPAGAYAAEALLKADAAELAATVDVIDRLPTPWGLVRSGVAPDHPQIKSVTRVFERIADRPGFRFVGGVRVGADIAHDELLERYDALVYCLGAEAPRHLGVPGEALAGVVPAIDLVRWYNAHPDAAGSPLPAGARRVAVVGNGNVALDCARMLIQDPRRLHATDASVTAVAALAESPVAEVVVVGRRGAADASFTLAELQELGGLDDVEIAVEGDDLVGDEPAVALLRTYAERPARPGARRLVFRFHAVTVGIAGQGAVTGLQVVPNGEGVATIPCDVVVPAIGFEVRAPEGLPLDERGVVVHEDGRVAPGVYVAGWAKRGPSGVIGTNRRDAAQTVAVLLADVASGAIAAGLRTDGIDDLLRERDVVPVPLEGWRAIDAAEREAGERSERPRVKLATYPDLRDAAAGQRLRGR